MKNCAKWHTIRKIEEGNQKGYSLVELVVTIILVMLLASGIVFGAEKWAEWNRFQKVESMARDLFSAAQNQLAEYEKNGQIGEFSEKIISHAKKIDTGSLIAADGKCYTGQDDIYVVRLTPESYAAYLTVRGQQKDAQEEELSADCAAVYDLLYDYLYDPSALRAYICVELSQNGRELCGIVYCDGTKIPDYREESAIPDGISLLNREESYRREQMFGYYGVLSVGKSEGGL